MQISSSLFFTFKDHRDSRGKGYLIGPGERVFNHVSRDTNWELRLKFAKIFLFNIPSCALLKLPTKCVDFITGGSFIRGYELGKQEFQHHCYLAHKTEKKISSLAKSYFITKCTLTSVIKDIIKIATLPIYVVGIQLVSLAGLFSPLDALLMTSVIEEVWDQNGAQRMPDGGVKMKVHLFYIAPCMQSQQTWKKQNLYRIFFDDYNPGTMRSLKLKFENLNEELAPYLSEEEKNQNQDLITRWRDEIIRSLIADADQTDKDGHLLPLKDEALDITKNIQENIRRLEQKKSELASFFHSIESQTG